MGLLTYKKKVVMIVLGIDPVLQITGFVILKRDGNRSFLLDFGFSKLNPSKFLQERIKIFLDYLRGILYLIAQNNNLIIHEFSPREIKAAVAGFGIASKDQVARIMLQFFPRLYSPKKLNVTDALAISLCGLWHYKYIRLTK